MALKNHIFPLFLKGDPQVIATGNAATVDWTGKTSLIHVDTANTAITSVTLVKMYTELQQTKTSPSCSLDTIRTELKLDGPCCLLELLSLDHNLNR
jgi:hypothetical protein